MLLQPDLYLRILMNGHLSHYCPSVIHHTAEHEVILLPNATHLLEFLAHLKLSGGKYVYVTWSAKTGLICTSNCTHSQIHIFTLEYANKLKFASFIVLCLVSHTYVKFYTCTIHTG